MGTWELTYTHTSRATPRTTAQESCPAESRQPSDSAVRSCFYDVNLKVRLQVGATCQATKGVCRGRKQCESFSQCDERAASRNNFWSWKYKLHVSEAGSEGSAAHMDSEQRSGYAWIELSWCGEGQPPVQRGLRARIGHAFLLSARPAERQLCC